MSISLKLNVLGRFEAQLSSGEIVSLPTRKTEALLTYLALVPGSHSRDHLTNLLWSDRGEQQARNSLRQALNALKKLFDGIEPQPLQIERMNVNLANQLIEVDAFKLAELVQDQTPQAAAQATKLYRGEFLEGLMVRDSNGEEWLAAQRERFGRLATQVLENAVVFQLESGELNAARETGERLVSLDRLNESAWQKLMRVYMARGERNQALMAYRRCLEILEKELGVDPTFETTALRAEIKDETPDMEAKFIAAESGKAADLVSESAVIAGISISEGPDIPSIVVLPFVNMSGDAEQEYFADGITEDIITELSRFRSLFVIARNSSFHYKGKSPKVQDVGRELGVQYIVEGSVRKVGNKVRVNAQLIDGVNGGHLWAERYDRDLTDIFAVQDDITQMVVSTLAGGVEDAALARAKQKSTENLAAHDYVLRGDNDYWGFTKDGVMRSRRAYLKAIELDPDYARAYSGLALTYISDWGFLWGKDPDDDLERAFEYAQKAVALDEAENRAYCVLGYAQAFQRDYARARASLERAVELNPNDAHTLAQMPYLFQLLGDCDMAIEMGVKALRLNPHRPSWYLIFLAEAYFTARRYEDAIATFESATGELPDTAAFLAATYAQFGRIDDARALMASFLESADPEPWWSNVPASTPPVENDRTGLLRYMLYMYPYKNPDDLDHLLDGLRKAGLEG